MFRVPIGDMRSALAKGEIDALAIWEQETGMAQMAIGADAIVFQDDKACREVFNLNTTEGRLKEPVTRAKIVRFVKAVMTAQERLSKNRADGYDLVVEQTKHPRAEVAEGMKTHSYPTRLPADLMDVLVTEELWLAKDEKRAPRVRAELANLIDSSVIEDARNLR